VKLGGDLRVVRRYPRLAAIPGLVGWCTFLAVLVTLLFGALQGFRSFENAAGLFISSFIICNCMGLLIGVVLGPIWGRLWALRFPVNWLAVVPVILAVAAVGLALALVIVVTLRFMPARDAVAQYRQMYPFVSVITLIFGIWGTGNAVLEIKLRQTSEALEAKRQEELRARQMAAEARLSSLESRVRPHFLFNTLNSISELVHEDPVRAEKLIDDLSSLLRSSLDSSHQPAVRLGDELRLVENYLSIERARFGDRVRSHLDVPEALLNAAIPPFSLQPLVENSVKHAVAHQTDGARIVITAARNGDALSIAVEDDGPGFVDADLPAGHGLETLRSRLETLYGSRASVRAARQEARTIVTLTLPFSEVTSA
jgi:sensor histidine kinase YesM